MDSNKSNLSLLGGLIGNTIEWFEFSVYGYLTPILATLFFPILSSNLAILNTLAVFAVGFIMRPMGGLFFGFIGDKYGRKTSLVSSIVLMSISTLLMVFLPTYTTIGFMAPILLVILRLLQGFSAGGELTSSMVYFSELARARSRGFYSSFTMFAAYLGVLFGSLIGAVLTELIDKENLLNWVWRIPFLFAAALGVVGYFLRSKAVETEVFKKYNNKNYQKSRSNISAYSYYNLITKMILIAACCAISFYLAFVFIPIYLNNSSELSYQKVLTINTMSMFILILLILLFSWLSDKINRMKVLLIGNIGIGLFSYTFFYFVLNNPNYVFALQIFFAIFIAASLAPLPAVLSELSPSSHRRKTVSFGFNMGAAFFGGIAPMLITYMISATKSFVLPSFYLIKAACLSTFAIYLSRYKLLIVL